ncbi:MAG: hypothetical protein Q4E05_09805 [Pseudoclavibacter sp.]|nr:hypothetical protein [Pseudoclavibacter sp.]
MNASNRFANRMLLLLAGLVLIALAGLALLHLAEPLRTQPWAAQLLAALGGFGQWAVTPLELPLAGRIAPILLLVPLASLLLIVLLAVFVATRGGGRISSVLHRKSPAGRTLVNRDVAQGLLADPLGERRDVISARTRSYRVKGAPALMLDITVRRGADLGRVLAAAEDAVREWDGLLGARVPMVIHFSDRGMLDGMRSSTRAR